MLKYNRFSFFILILFKLTVLISNTENTDKYNHINQRFVMPQIIVKGVKNIE